MFNIDTKTRNWILNSEISKKKKKTDKVETNALLNLNSIKLWPSKKGYMSEFVIFFVE